MIQFQLLLTVDAVMEATNVRGLLVAWRGVGKLQSADRGARDTSIYTPNAAQHGMLRAPCLNGWWGLSVMKSQPLAAKPAGHCIIRNRKRQFGPKSELACAEKSFYAVLRIEWRREPMTPRRADFDTGNRYRARSVTAAEHHIKATGARLLSRSRSERWNRSC